MIVRAAMVEYMLEKAGYLTVLLGDETAEITRVKLLRERKRKAKTLYVCDGPPTSKLRTGEFLYPAQNCKADAVELLEAVNDALLSLQEWDIRLKDNLAHGLPLGDFLQLAEEVLPYVFAFYDREVSVLGASSNFGELFEDDSWAGYDASDCAPGVFPAGVMADLFEDDEYSLAAERKEPFYFSAQGSPMHASTSYCTNFFVDDTYAARLVVIDQKGYGTLAVGAEQLIAHFSTYLAEHLTRFTGSDVQFGNQHDSLHEFFRGLLLGQEKTDTPTVERVLAPFGWTRHSTFSVVKFVFFEAVNWESATLFICQQLERKVRSSCALPHGRSIIWVVNTALMGDEMADSIIIPAVVETIRTYACKAGLSNVLDDFASAQIALAECEAALSVGQTHDPHLWYYRFGDYVLDYMMDKACEGLPPEELASHKVLALREVDSREGAAYVETLRCFLDNKQNATHTAEVLFMHRTSLLRRLERIARIGGIDFDDPDEVFHLQLSLRLLER